MTRHSTATPTGTVARRGLLAILVLAALRHWRVVAVIVLVIAVCVAKPEIPQQIADAWNATAAERGGGR